MPAQTNSWGSSMHSHEQKSNLNAKQSEAFEALIIEYPDLIHHYVNIPASFQPLVIDNIIQLQKDSVSEIKKELEFKTIKSLINDPKDLGHVELVADRVNALHDAGLIDKLKIEHEPKLLQKEYLDIGQWASVLYQEEEQRRTYGSGM